MSSLAPPRAAANLRAYFSQYPGFKYDPHQPATSEFRRLCTFLDRRGGNTSRAALLQAFSDSLGNQFGEKYGVEMNDLSAWHKLCRRLGINPIPEGLRAAQEAVWTTHFNLVDLIDDGPDGQLPIFPNRKILKAYSFKKKNGFPRQCSTAGAIMTSLLNGGPPSTSTTGARADDVGTTVVESLGSLHIQTPRADMRPPTTLPAVELIEEIYSPATSVYAASARANFRDSPTRPLPSSTGRRFVVPQSNLQARSEVTSSDLPSPDNSEPLPQFFAQYRDVGFRYDHSVLPLLEYQRLARHLAIPRVGATADSMFEKFARAMTAEFSTKFGTRTDDLVAWQRLCKHIGIDPVPATLGEARAEFKKTHVNLVELILMRSIADGEMKKFDTEEDLAEWTRSEPGRTFPRWFVAKGSLLEHLLRHIWN